LYAAQKATVTMRRSPARTSVFRSLLNCTSEIISVT